MKKTLKYTETLKDITREDEQKQKEDLEKSKNKQDAPITRSELRNVLKAMDKEGFSSLVNEYIKEISDPNNVKEQNQFLEESYKNKDLPNNVVLAKPEKEFCIETEKKQKGVKKSKCSKMKVYINLCSLDKVPKPEQCSKSSQWSLPYLINKSRNDLDKDNNHCQTFDVVFNPLAFELSKKYLEFKKFMCDNAVSGINSKLLSLNKEEASMDYELVSEFKYKGMEVALMNVYGLVNNSEYINKLEDAKDYKTKIMKDIEDKKANDDTNYNNNNNESNANEFDMVDIEESEIKNNNNNNNNNSNSKFSCNNKTNKQPKYTIKYSDNFEMHNLFYNPSKVDTYDNRKTNIIIKLELVDLPDNYNIAEAILEIKDKNLELIVKDIYYFNLELKTKIKDNTIQAKWDKSKKELTITGEVEYKKVNYEEKEDKNCEIVKEEELKCSKDNQSNNIHTKNDCDTKTIENTNTDLKDIEKTNICSNYNNDKYDYDTNASNKQQSENEVVITENNSANANISKEIDSDVNNKKVQTSSFNRNNTDNNDCKNDLENKEINKNYNFESIYEEDYKISSNNSKNINSYNLIHFHNQKIFEIE